ncbi:PREDICTED: ADAM 17-like protease [Acropora digitifera]|uniref:ADAM 17-like protease n=1 Tax=Acropora digitifera TaxID=70779 RepID=UPI00077ADF08|nr:PREDICTED: ADAM 17-like protease [Acropora digitifera]
MIFLRKCENCNIVTMPGFSYLGSLILTYTIVCVSEVAKGELEHVLNHYETLHAEDVFHGVHKRDTYTALQEKIVSFTALGRHFRLHLTPNTGLFDEEFRAYSVGPNDVKTEIPINKDSFYRGYDEDDASSEARVHDDYGVLTASIATKSETYVIEPAWRHLRQSSSEQMIAYRHSDVKSNITHPHNDPKNKKYSFCGHDSEHSTVYYKENVGQDLRSHRRKRAASTLIRCRLALVADHRFYQEMGQRDESKTVNYMIGVADRVSTIFERTEWSNEYVGYGFEIAQVIVHENISSEGSRHEYNRVKEGRSIKELLKDFSRDSEWKKYCLAHLFTYQDFKDGVIGLAYVGNRKRNAVGGICTEDYFASNEWLYLNTGLSSTINWGRKLLTEEADIVTAHEIGHNFGSEHDPDTDECAPGDTRAEGGKFIMYPASVSGQFQNNKEFSPCSKRRILGVLQSKSQFCFTEPRNEICGNYKKEANEECDPGGISPKDTNCCTKNCKLQPRAVCSDGYDSPCCRDCVYSNVFIKCREEDRASCKKESYCNGSSPSCPVAESMDDGIECLDSAVFLTAKFNVFHCTDLRSERIRECKKLTQDLVKRFWTFLTTLDSDKVAKFMKDNLAGTVVVFSLLIWIPGSCYINHQDRKRDKQEALEAEWRDKRSTKLLREPKPTSKGKFIYRQESISRSSRAHKPYKVKAINIKTNRIPKLEQVRETDF